MYTFIVIVFYIVFFLQMQLVIYGKEDIETLAKYAENIFSSVKNKDITRPAFAPKTSFPDAYNGKIVYFVPVADKNSVSVFWQVPPTILLYREQVQVLLNENKM